MEMKVCDPTQKFSDIPDDWEEVWDMHCPEQVTFAFTDDDIYPYIGYVDAAEGHAYSEESNSGGSLSHEHAYGELGYELDGLFDRVINGYWHIEEAEMSYSQDSYSGEVDGSFYCTPPRPARIYEVAMCERITLKVIWQQLKTSIWWNLKGREV